MMGELQSPTSSLQLILLALVFFQILQFFNVRSLSLSSFSVRFSGLILALLSLLCSSSEYWSLSSAYMDVLLFYYYVGNRLFRRASQQQWLIYGQIKSLIQYLTCKTSNMIVKALLLLALTLSLAHAEVVVLDDSNFTSFLSEHPYVFVQFYAPWCGHCKALVPQYEKLALQAEGKDYVIAKVDATVATNASQEYKVEGYPTLKFLANGVSLDYRGERTAVEIQTWIESFFSTTITVITENEVKQKIGSQDFLLIQGASTEQLKVLEIANFLDKSVEYYIIAEGEPKITLYLKKDSKTLDYTGELNVEDFTAWTIDNSSPSVVLLDSQEQTKAVFQNKEKLPALLLFRASDLPESAFATLSNVCEESKATFRCAFVDSTAALYKGVARYLKLSEFDVSVLAYVNYGLKQAYKFPNPSELTKQSIAQFLEEVKEGKVEKYIDHEKAEEKKEIEYVNVNKLNAETYNDTIANNKYVFVEYYSPNCGHCVSFAPEYEKLAAQVKEEGLNYVIAAVDLVTEKEVGDWVEVQGYPTLRFFINGRAVDYNGERKGQAILKFISEAINTRLSAAASVEQIPKPSVAVYGIGEDSELHFLPLSFTRHPIYHIQGDHEFKIEVHTSKGVNTYSGESDRKKIADWLDQSTQPLIVGVVDSAPTKRLNSALQGKFPLLIIVKRDETSTHVLSVMEQYCENKNELVCGYAAKEDKDYESFNEWLADNQPGKSVLLYINTSDFKKIIYDGDLSQLTTEQIDQFIQQIKQDQAKAEAEAEAGQEAPQETQQEAPQTPQEVPQEAPQGEAEPAAEESQEL